MALHLIKVAVGCDAIEDIARFQRERLKQRGRLFHVTRFRPKREAEIVGVGSMYWIVKGGIAVRQRIKGFEDATWPGRGPVCLILLDRALVPTRWQPRRAHQGWRYLDADDAPPDLPKGAKGEKAPPAKMAAELRALGLL